VLWLGAVIGFKIPEGGFEPRKVIIISGVRYIQVESINWNSLQNGSDSADDDAFNLIPEKCLQNLQEVH
jgi:hypothetical protein